MILWKSAVIVLCLWACENVATPLGSSSIAPITSNGINYRLRNETYPINYKLNLTTRIDKGDFGFQGKVQIQIGVVEPTNVISIHSNSTLNLTQIQLKQSDHQIPITYTYNETTEILLISSEQKMEMDQFYFLSISYDGVLAEDTDMLGFYRSWYVDDNNNKIYLATTQFEPTHARRAFPCYDEPKFKATFDISITHGKSYFALSNMAVKQEIDCDNETKTTVFETTVKMSSYLIAFVVSNYDHISKGNQRVFAEPKLIRNADYALETGLKVLDDLATYFNVSYSINKMDQISIPQFAAGAMENWGLVTYKEKFLIYDPQNHSISRKDDVAQVIAHEYTHQWFGNLVSPVWWTYLWLNEGFANYYETQALHLSFPEMRIDEMKIITLQRTFKDDSQISIRSMSTYADDPETIRSFFDIIAYYKSGYVLRMTNNFLTEPVWKDGLNQYLNNRGFDSARDTDLFDALQSAVDRSNVTLPTSVTEIMNTWTLNRGFPLISVKRINDGYHFSQKRFLEDNGKDPDNELWWVPINIATKSHPDFVNTSADTWFNTSEQSYIPSYKINPDDWFLINKKVMYYYRVNYDSKNWQKLADELNNGNHMKIDAQNRAQLMGDALLFAQNDQMDYGVALNIVKYLRRETEYIPWMIIDITISELYRKVEAVIQNDYLIFFMKETSEKLYKTYGPISAKGDSYHEKMARPLAIKWACKSGNEQCLADTLKLTTQFIYDHMRLEPETQESLICGGLRYATQDLFDDFMDKIKNVSDTTERLELFKQCSCIEDKEVLLNAIANIAVESILSLDEKRDILQTIYAKSHHGFTVLWKYIVDNWQTFFNDFGNDFAKGLANHIYHPEDELVAMDIFDKLNFSEEFKNSFKLQVEKNMVWASSRYNEIYKFLSEY